MVASGVFVGVLAAMALGQATGLESLAVQLDSVDPEKAVRAARRLGDWKGPDRAKAVNVLVEELLLGVEPAVGEAIVQALGKLGDPRALEAVLHATRHRDAKVRSAAVGAIARLANGKNAARVYRRAVRALRDGSSKVRVAGARALVELADKRLLDPRQWAEAERTLLALLYRRKDQLTAKVGLLRLGTERTARFLAVHMEDLPVPVVVAIYAGFLKRKDFGPDPVRYWVVRLLAGMNAPEALAAVMEYVARNQGVKGKPSVELARRIAEQ